MEVLQATTAICQAVEYIFKYVEACIHFGKEADRLHTNLGFEVIWLKGLQRYLDDVFSGTDLSSPVFNQLSPADQQAILKIRQHIGRIEVKAQKVLKNVQRQDKRQHLVRMFWVFIKTDAQDLASEISEWRQRLGIRILNLPERVATLYDLVPMVDSGPSPSAATATTAIANATAVAATSAGVAQASSPVIHSATGVNLNSPTGSLVATGTTGSSVATGTSPSTGRQTLLVSNSNTVPNATVSASTASPDASGGPASGPQPSSVNPTLAKENTPAKGSIQTKERISRYNALSQPERLDIAQKIFLADPASAFANALPNDSRTAFALLSNKQVLLEFRPYDPILQEDQNQDELKVLLDKTGDLSAELNNLDATTTSILQCVGYFNDTATSRIGSAFLLPFNVDTREPVRSMKDVILMERRSPSGKKRRISVHHSLNQRFVFARRIVTSVCYFHSFDWVHKDINSSNLIVLDYYDPDDDGSENEGKPDRKYLRFPYKLGHPYLVSFDKAREDKEISSLRDPNEEWVWHANIYRHPVRQYGTTTVQKHTTRHDLYSLGVVLLELGLWESVANKYAPKISGLRSKQVTAALIDIAKEDLRPIVGDRYTEAVIKCLSEEIDGDDASTVMRYLNEILDDMEEIAAHTS
ncbi:hypothetical protein H072_5356 [Dactylellina haptotyla CBS 200.50]|uniref:Protein kinase domain-containing protein n=1 Tax=Dactylellina haptotyla (strain CBS 200.50) TaxID=1284197 RepID=S8AI00_DACHA|nr:hypothetical protein H072_5356 [Dactylellina haptotyla CBS 200.50]